MINLKKNDKLIIIIAVAVIVVAAIGIIAYESPEDTGKGTGGVGGVKTFDVTWQTHTETYSPNDEFFAGKNEPYNKVIDIDHENILNVKFEISWTDDFTYGIFRTKGEDTLTASITYKGRTTTEESIGNGTMTFTFTVNSLPQDTIEAEDEIDAREKIDVNYYDYTYPSFEIDVSVQIGEKRFRPLKYRQDQGNDFDLKITYEYYDIYDIFLPEDEAKPTGNNDGPSDFEEQPAYLATIVNIGLTRW